MPPEFWWWNPNRDENNIKSSGNNVLTYPCTWYTGKFGPWYLTHWGRVTHICVSRLTITGSNNGLSPGRRQAIIWTSAGVLLIGPLGTNFSENLIEILTFLFTKMRLKVSSTKWRPLCLGLNVLNIVYISSQGCYVKALNFITDHFIVIICFGLGFGVIQVSQPW